MKRYSLFAVLSVSMVVVAMAFVKTKDEQPAKHLEIVLRTIGHEVLLHSSDSTSRVLPVRKLDDNTYLISFENSFGFNPDTLMHIVHRELAKTDRRDGYTVSVNECVQNQTIFAYEIDHTNGDLTPCRGREQKKGCYVIEISFINKSTFHYGWLLLLLLPAILGALYFASRKTRISKSRQPVITETGNSRLDEAPSLPPVDDVNNLGAFSFFESKGILSLNGENLQLSSKEAKALSILLSNRNEVVGRDLLMKEIWEDDGVVVITRNVDVLISKLRKKLSADPSVKIVNVHGKGYKMIV